MPARTEDGTLLGLEEQLAVADAMFEIRREEIGFELAMTAADTSRRTCAAGAGTAHGCASIGAKASTNASWDLFMAVFLS